MLETTVEPLRRYTTLNLRVVIAEDQPEVARFFAVLLSQYGCEVEECHSGPDVITVAPDFMPEVLLLDIGLPGLDGYGVAKRLTEQMGPLRPYIIAITAFTQDRFRKQADQAGIDLFLTKPVSSGELIEHLVRWRDG